METSTYTNREVIKRASMFVCAVAHYQTDHGSREVVENGKTVKRCKIYGNISCEEHRNMTAASARFDRISGIPTTVFCDPEGTELSRERYMDGSTLSKKMDEVLGRVSGPKLSREQWKAALKALQVGQDYVEAGKYGAAHKEFKKVLSVPSKSLKEEARKRIDDLDAMGRKLIEEALALEDPAERKKALKRIRSGFRGLPCSKQAAAELRKIK